ncbi:MAG TPA: amidohydrolase family protein [Pseudonocardiaceae bacterium]|jgi:predicted TIM-barrel fold metal-dependent hydrolase|nr:amidohydrolase family protein [Pseudonocardiaceae bacterium]
MIRDFTLPILDAHHHLWNVDGIGHYPWLQDRYDENYFLGDYQCLRTDFLPPQYHAATEGFDIAGTVHVEAERSRSQQYAETAWLTSVSQEYGIPSAIVAHVGFTQPDRDDVLARHAGNPLVVGIRCKPRTAPSADQGVEGRADTLQDHDWLAGLARLEHHGLSWDLRVPYWHLAEAAAVVRQLPGVPVVLEHCGLPLDRTPGGLARWSDGLAELADSPHVTVKISELGLRGGRWDAASTIKVVQTVVRTFGWDRIMFGSNLPVSGLSVTFANLIDTILRALADADETQLRALFADNARRVYRITD